MYNIFKVWPGDFGPDVNEYIGTVETLEEAEAYKKAYYEKNPRRDSWEPYIWINKIEFTKF